MQVLVERAILEGMPPWHDYQEHVAEFFRSLYMDAHVEQRIKGARSTHAVDVVVRPIRAGIRQLWIVECKLWHRPVDKECVATLAEITKDVGADRGFLLSESGFQPGAVSLAKYTNITLSSLSGLKEGAGTEPDVFAAGLAALEFASSLIDKFTPKSANAVVDPRYKA